MKKSKKVLVIGASPRKNGNSNRLAEEFARGAADAGNEAEVIYLYDKQIGFCRGCLVCQNMQKCVIQDDADVITEKMKEAEVIAFATPIYFYEMNGQLKTLLDRSNPLYPSDYAFRDIYMLTSAADDGETVPKKAESGLEGWIDCFEKARFAGCVFAGGVDAMGAIEGHTALQTAYEMGRKA